jgi:hypothetical protein
MTHNLQLFKPITYNLSSENPVSKFAFQMRNLRRYNGVASVVVRNKNSRDKAACYAHFYAHV